MSDPITLEQCKSNMRILHNYEDDFIESLIPVAVQAVADHIDRDLTDPYCLKPDGSLKAPLTAAMVLLVGDLYKHRESQGQALSTNMTFVNLLQRYVKAGV